jgi:hypothetical protein
MDHRAVAVADRSSIAGRMFANAGVWSLLLILSACSPDPSGKELSFGATEKVCQLTGDKDWATHADTTARTGTRFSFFGTDLGYPVEHNDRMVLFFGDSRIPLPQKRDESGPPDDAIGFVFTHTPPTKDRCLDLTINHERFNVKAPVSPVVGPPRIKQGIFNVPSGGVSSNGFLYGFFFTDHCNNGNDPTTCPGTDSLNKIGRGVLARSEDNGSTFLDPVPMPRDFVYSTAFDSEAAAGLPSDQRPGIYVFGVPEYRASDPYLAHAPQGGIGDPSTWLFFTGLTPDGQPSWTSRDVWERRGKSSPPPGRPDLFALSGQDRCVGELSVTWNRALHAWLLLYNCDIPKIGQVIVARVAAAPWGPWSRASILLDPKRDHSWCHLLWQAPGKGNGCDDLDDEWFGTDLAGTKDGAFYAPFVMERYTTPEGSPRLHRRQATIYWLLSTFNPYQVDVMRTSLTIDESLLTTRAVLNRRWWP